MKFPLFAACLIAGSTWSFANADQTAAINPKTAAKPFTSQQPNGSTVVYTSKTGAPILKNSADPRVQARLEAERVAQKLAAMGGQPNQLVQGGGHGRRTPTGSGGSLPLIGGDDCSSAAPIAGTGTFPFDTSGATTSAQQQGCGGGCDSDVWFSWTAPTTGVATASLCGGTSMDSVLAIWSGSGCGASPLGCDDDGYCSGVFTVQSTVLFPVTAGSSYMIQIGGFFQSIGPGSFTLSVALPPANDNCTSPTTIVGTGSFPFDNSAASTGTQGQNESLCLAYGSTTVANDVWFTWTAPASGCTIIDNCGDAVDAKVAVYQGSGCPVTGTALACNDDSCGLQSKISFNATAGTTYTIQFGTYPFTFGGAGNFNITQVGAGIGNDNCSNPTVIAGTGVFPFDNSAATTGCEGQNEAACAAQYGQFTVDNDVWFTWTAPTTGFAVWDDCGLTGIDTKVAAYQGAGCPVAGTALACIDDSCPGFQSTLVWPVTAGTTYTIQVGNFPGATGGIGSFSLNVVLPPTNDDCTGSIALGPVGPYPFALLGASTGATGQNEPLCNFYGMTAVENDIWYTWTAPSTGRASLSLCAGSSFDSKVAVYAGSGCPTAGSAIACNDDACGLTSEMCFDVTGGSTYTIQVGTFPGAGNTFVGSFDINLGPALPPCTLDDGTTENLLTWTNGGDMVWLNRFGTPGGSTVLNSVSVIWGSAMFPGNNPASNGQFATDIFVWQDGVSQDGDPSDATLLLTIPTTVTVWDTDTYVNFPIAPLSISGVFFVGCHQDNYGLSGMGPTQFVAPMDTNCPSSNVAWFFGNNSGYGTSPTNYGSPGSNVQPPVTFDSIGFPCQVTVRAGCSSGPATYLCDPGSGGTLACPCANPAVGTGKGCDNSSATGGASITGAGTNSLSTPTVAFTSAGEKPTATSILLQGTASNPAGQVFGQGVRCATGVLKRLYVKAASGGSILAPNFGAGDISIPARSASVGDPISAGQSRWYLVYYRDPIVLGGCSVLSTFNATNTAQVLWQP